MVKTSIWDVGKHTTKGLVVGNDENKAIRRAFATAMGYANDGSLDQLGGTHSISAECIGKNTIILGSNKLPIKPDDNFSKDSLITKASIILGLALTAAPGDILDVCTSCPHVIFNDKKQRLEFCNNVIPKGKLSCVIDDKPIEFIIQHRLILPESTGYIYLHPDLFGPTCDDAAIIDIGGLNMNISAVNGGSIIVESCHTSNHGGRKLVRTVQSLLRDNEIEISEHQVLGAIQRGIVKQSNPAKEEKSKQLISQALAEYTAEIYEAVKTYLPNFESLQLYFTGGTSFLVRAHLQKCFGAAAHFEKSLEDAQFANVNGFYIKMKQMLDK